MFVFDPTKEKVTSFDISEFEQIMQQSENNDQLTFWFKGQT